MNKIEKLEITIRYIFKNKKLAEMAITHKSYAHDMKNEMLNSYNERVEFLGDAILEYIISKELYNRLPNEKEGTLTKRRARIVCEESLCSVIKRNNLSDCLRVGKCERKIVNSRKDAMLADMFEAILGAVYLDGGFDVAEKVCLKMLNKTIEDEINNITENKDYKTRLQEEIQKEKNKKIEYKLIEEVGPAHDKIFYVAVYINN